jgi:3-deoxy-manno-octulosonate cytidylyltransferase (CMP-KDO synthetase)
MLAVIPARLASTRLPNKVLLRETGKYLLQHVWERVKKARRVDRIVVAADHPDVQRACREFGAECVMTSTRHASGTSRVGEVAKKLKPKRVVNVQGDEPDVDPAAIDRLAKALDESELATLATPFADPKEADNPNRVKVVVDRNGDALYFSRSNIPYPREPKLAPRLHVGMYAYRYSALLRWIALPPSRLEETEKLEQLRVLEHGLKIRVVMLSKPWPGGIDTPEDYRRFVARTLAKTVRSIRRIRGRS